jgi:hypothetical protein
VTVDGHRHFYIYTHDSEENWSARLETLGEHRGYPLALAFRSNDEKRRGYWQELFPTDDDWQVIKDLGVIEALEKEGDDGTASRRIDHWAYFPSKLAAEQYSQWAKEQGYTLQDDKTTDNGKFCIQFAHEGTLRLTDITSHTIALRRKAEELGGDYDGWEVPVCKSPA